MRRREFCLSAEEISAFREAEAETRNVYELKRLQAVRLYGMGEPVDSIQRLVGCGPASPRQWSILYKQAGIAGLRVAWARGNANKLTEEQRHELSQKLAAYKPNEVIPAEMRVERGEFWTVSDLQIVVERWFGVTYQSETSYRNLLHTSGFSYQKVERVYRSRPSAAQLAEFEADLEKK